MEGKVDHRETSMDHQSEGSSEAYPARPSNSYEGFQGGHLILVKIKIILFLNSYKRVSYKDALPSSSEGATQIFRS